MKSNFWDSVCALINAGQACSCHELSGLIRLQFISSRVFTFIKQLLIGFQIRWVEYKNLERALWHPNKPQIMALKSFFGRI